MRRFLHVVGLLILLATGSLRPVAIAQDNNLRPISLGSEFRKMVWNQDGTLLAISQRSRINIHDADLNLVTSLAVNLPSIGSLVNIVWTKDNHLLFVEKTAEETYQLSHWDGEQVHSLLTDVSFVRLSSDEQWLAGVVQGQFMAWDTSTGTNLRSFMTRDRRIYSIQWHPIEPWLLVWSYSRDDVSKDNPEIIIWDVENDEILGAIPQIDTVLGAGIQQIVWHPTAPQLAVLADQIYIWDIPTQDFQDFIAVSAFERLKKPITIQWHSDGQRLGITMADSQRIWFWDISTDEISIWDGHKSPIIYWRWVVDNQQLLTISKDSMVMFRDSTTGAELARMTVAEDTPQNGLNQYVLRPQSNELWIFDELQYLSAIDIATHEFVATYYDYVLPTQLTWSADGSTIVDETLGVGWGVTTGRAFALQPSETLDNTTVWSPNGQLLASFVEDSKQVSIWRDDTLQATIDICEDESCVVQSVAWNHQNNQLVVVEIYGNDTLAFNIYDVFSGKALLPHIIGLYRGTTIYWTPDDQYIYFQFTRDSARFYNATTGEDLGTWRNFSYSPDGTRAARIDFESDSTQIMVLDAVSFEPLVIVDTYINPQANPSFVWNPQSTHLAFMEGSSQAIQILDADTLKVVETLPESDDHTSTKAALAWSPDGKQLAYIDYGRPVKGTIFIWKPDYR